MHQILAGADMWHIDLVEEQDDGEDEEVDVGAVSRAEDYRALPGGLQLPDHLQLALIDDDLVVDSLEERDHRVGHGLQRGGLVVCHDDVERRAGRFADLLVDLVLVHIQLEGVLVVGQLRRYDLGDSLLH